MNSVLIGKNSNLEKEDMYRKHLTGNTLRVSCIQGQGTQGKAPKAREWGRRICKGMGTEDFLDNEKRVLPWVPGAVLGGAVGLTGAHGRERADKQ